MTRDPECLFCKIIHKEIPARVVMAGDDYVAIRDINPQAPTHILLVPRLHVGNVTEFEDATALGRLFQAARDVAAHEKLDRGFRLVVNTGADGGQTVNHLHIHLLGGRHMTWPPG